MTALLLLALAAGPPLPALDDLGDPLPEGAVARLGSSRFLHDGIAGPVLSPDGKFIATATPGGVRISSVADGRTLHLVGGRGVARLAALMVGGPKGPRFAPSFSRDGGRLAVLEGDHKATVWHLRRNERLRAVESYLGRMAAVALSPDGRSLAICFDTVRHVIRIWDVKSGADLATLEAGVALFQGAAFSPDGRTLATVQSGGRLTLWDVAKKKPLAEKKSARRELAALCFSPDGKKLALAGADGTADFHDARTGGLLSGGKGPEGVRLTGLAFRADGKALAVGTRDSRAILWDAASGKLLWRDVGHKATVHALAFRPNGDLVSGAADGCIVWRAGTWAVARRAKRPLPKTGPAEVERTFLSHDGRYAVWAGASGAELVDTDSGRSLGSLAGPRDRPSPHPLFAFSPDGRRLAKVLPLAARAGPGRVRIWALPGLRGWRDAKLDIEDVGAYRQQQAAFSPDGWALALTGCRIVRVPRGRRGILHQASQGGAFDLVTEKQLGGFPMPLEGGLAWSPDGRMLAAANLDGGISFVKASDGKALGAVSPSLGARLVAFSPCGRLLAVALAEGRKVAVYESVTGTPRFMLEGHTGPVLALAFSHDGRLLATGGQDTTILVWDMGPRRGGEADGAKAWAALGDVKAAPGYAAVSALARRPAAAVALLRKHLKPAPGRMLGDTAVEKAIERLSADDFETRQSSQEALAAAAWRIAPRLEEALGETADVEVQHRLNAALKIGTAWPRPDLARAVRAVEVLERLGTQEARKFLRELSSGNADARLTREAKAALKRLEKSP
jgi:WD40 repeat protein